MINNKNSIEKLAAKIRFMGGRVEIVSDFSLIESTQSGYIAYSLTADGTKVVEYENIEKIKDSNYYCALNSDNVLFLLDGNLYEIKSWQGDNSSFSIESILDDKYIILKVRSNISGYVEYRVENFNGIVYLMTLAGKIEVCKLFNGSYVFKFFGESGGLSLELMDKDCDTYNLMKDNDKEIDATINGDGTVVTWEFDSKNEVYKRFYRIEQNKLKAIT